jgi:hypothetical protein
MALAQGCDHNCIPCRGNWRARWRAGWVCVRCDRWFAAIPVRLGREEAIG